MPPKRKKPDPVVDTDKALDKLMAEATGATTPNRSVFFKVNELGQRLQRLQAGYDYVNNNQATVAFNDTIRNVLGRIQRGIDSVAKALKDAEAQQTAEENRASRMVVEQDGAYAGDGHCYVNFVNVGMGDCTVITTPAGVRIMIDCGSASTSDVVQDDSGVDPIVRIRHSITAPTFLGNATAIDLLLLTHPDSDHHDKLEAILQPLNVKFTVVYYGGADRLETYDSSAYLKEAGADSDFSSRKVILCEQSTLENDEVVLVSTVNAKTPAKTGKAGQLGYDFTAKPGAPIVVYYEGQDIKPDFRLSIIAANVTGVWDEGVFVKSDSDIKTAGEMKLNGTKPNKRSLMILVECFGRTLLVCGDATAVTERFVVDSCYRELAAVGLLRVGHHGSATSSSKAFIEAQTSLAVAVVSTGGKITTTHHLPKEKILQLYQPKVRDDADVHSIYAFQSDDGVAQLYFKSITNALWATGSNDSYNFSIPKP